MNRAVTIGTAALAVIVAATPRSDAAIIWGVNDQNNLFSFDTSAPQNILSGSFLPNSIGIVQAIDFRPANPSQLWVVTNENINTYTVIPPNSNPTQAPNHVPFLQGSAFGVDFNPVVDALRVVSDTDLNGRLSTIPAGGFTTDTPLAYAAGDPNFGDNPSVVGVAYTNNFSGATSTTLYGIDSVNDVLVRIGSVNGTPNSPNGGLLTTVGALGVDATNLLGFDIGPDGIAYAAIQQPGNGVSGLYTINLNTGAATLVGTIGGGMFVRDISVVIPEPASMGLLAFGALGLLRRRARP